jgi:hypothetical protein
MPNVAKWANATLSDCRAGSSSISVLLRIGFARLRRRRCTGELLPRHFTLACRSRRCVSVALSLKSPSAAVSSYPALRSSDFPHIFMRCCSICSPGIIRFTENPANTYHCFHGIFRETVNCRKTAKLLFFPKTAQNRGTEPPVNDFFALFLYNVVIEPGEHPGCIFIERMPAA